MAIKINNNEVKNVIFNGNNNTQEYWEFSPILAKIFIQGNYIWSDGKTIYYSSYDNQYCKKRKFLGKNKLD